MYAPDYVGSSIGTIYPVIVEILGVSEWQRWSLMLSMCQKYLETFPRLVVQSGRNYGQGQPGLLLILVLDRGLRMTSSDWAAMAQFKVHSNRALQTSRMKASMTWPDLQKTYKIRLASELVAVLTWVRRVGVFVCCSHVSTPTWTSPCVERWSIGMVW